MALLPQDTHPTAPPPVPLPHYLAAKGYTGEGRSLKLKRLLLRHKLTIAELARNVMKSNGQPFSRPSLQNVVTYGVFPQKTSYESIRAQINTWLAAQGVPEGEIATAFELEDAVVALNGHPGAHEGHADLAGQLRAAGVDEAVIDATLARMRYDPARRAQRYAATKPAPVITPLEKTMLTPAAKKHFGLAEDPFSEEIHDAADIFRGTDVNENREILWNWSTGTALGALIGESGSGKSWLRQDLEDRIARSNEKVRLIRPPMIDAGRITARVLCESIVFELAPGEKVCSSPAAATKQITDLLKTATKEGWRCVMLIEEAHKLTVPALRDLKAAFELQDGFKRLLSVVLIGQNPEMDELLNEIRNSRARELIKRISRVYVKPLHTNALKPFLAHKFERAGASVDRVLDDSAYGAILADRIKFDPKSKRVANDCYPLAVQTLVTRAMNEAAALGAPRVTADIVVAAVKLGGR